MSTLGLANVNGRCSHGFAPIHHPDFCNCTEAEWHIFVSALRAAVDREGRIHQHAVRPRIRGRIEPKHIGTLYRRAKAEGLIAQVGKEPSTDATGRNTHHDSPIYQLRSAAA